MSVYIEGMEMPSNCHNCDLCALVDVSDGLVYGCRVLRKQIVDDRQRQPDCPLTEVSRHGRLIDADSILTDVPLIYASMVFGGKYVFTQGAIDRAPTVIPASEGYSLAGEDGPCGDGEEPFIPF